MYQSLMNIHGIFNKSNATQKDALIYEAQLEENLQTLIEVLEYLNPNLYYKITSTFNLEQGAAKNIKAAHAKRELCQILRDFNESLGSTSSNLQLTCMIWDNIFLKCLGKKRSVEIELYLAFAIILCVMADDLMLCKTPSEFVMTIRTGIGEVHTYDFYLIYVEVHTKQLLPQLKEDEQEYERSIVYEKSVAQLSRKSTVVNPLNDQFDRASMQSKGSMRGSKISVKDPKEEKGASFKKTEEEAKESVERPKSKISHKGSEEKRMPTVEDQKLSEHSKLPNIHEDKEEEEGSVKEEQSPAVLLSKGTLGIPDIDEYNIFAETN